MANQAKTHKIKMMEEQLAKKLNRQVVGSLVGCVHCGMCDESCHYVLAFPDDHKMTPSYKADQVRKLFKANHDWTGSVFPWWVGADKVPLSDDDLETLKDIAFGTCTNCRRCTLSCPMGVDTATLNRIMRGLLSHVGVMPEGVRVVSKDQWEIGNQMGVLKEDYIDTIEWMSEELEEDLGHAEATIPMEKKGAKVMYCINPREVKYDPRTIKEAALIFWAAGEDWTMPSEGWDNTNFGLFSGDDGLGGACAKREYDKARELGVDKIVISECGHGYRSTRHEGVNWSGETEPFPMESSVSSRGYAPPALIAARRSLSPEKVGRASSGSSTKGAMVMSPRRSICSHRAAASQKGAVSSGRRPYLASSPETFTSARMSVTTAAAPERFSISSRSRIESTEWRRANRPITSRTFLRWRWPIMCQRTDESPSSSILAMPSGTRFSPRSNAPSSTRARASAGPTAFVTATSLTGVRSRPDRRLAPSMRFLTDSRLRAITSRISPISSTPLVEGRF